MRLLKTFLGTTALLVGLALAPAANAQVMISIGVQPSCAYGYDDYAPYGCAPMGFYGPGYFYNGIFLGMGPWAGWGYGHGWGGHRFNGERGGSYHGNGGYAAAANYNRGGGGHGYAAPAHNNGARPSASHASAPRGGGGSSHAAPAHSGGGHAGGGHK